FNRAVFGSQNRLALGVETQLAILYQRDQMGIFHLIERREFLQKFKGALNVLQYCCPTSLGKSVRLAHGYSMCCVKRLTASSKRFQVPQKRCTGVPPVASAPLKHGGSVMVGRGPASQHWT